MGLGLAEVLHVAAPEGIPSWQQLSWMD